MKWSRPVVSAAGFGLALFALALIGILSLSSAEDLAERNRWVTHTLMVKERIVLHEVAILDTSRSVRGFIITGEETFLAPYDESCDQIADGERELRELLRDNPSQLPNLLELEKEVDALIALLERQIKMRREQGIEVVTGLVRSGVGNRQLAHIRELVDVVLDEEDRLLADRTSEAEASMQRTILLIVAACGLAILLVGGSAVIVHRDQRLQAKILRQLRDSEEQLHDFLDSAHDLVISIGPDGKFLFVNRAWRDKLGYSAEQAAELEVTRIVHPEQREAFNKTLTELQQRDGSVFLETRFVSRSGRVLWVTGNLNCRRVDGAAVAIRGIFRDETENKRVQRRFHLAVESSPMAMVMTNDKGQILLLNEKAERLFGYSRSELLGSEVEVLIPQGMRSAHREHRGEYMADPRVRQHLTGREFLAVRRDGSEFPIEITLQPIDDEEGGTLVLAVIEDITQRQKLERERREALSTLAESERRFRAIFDQTFEFIGLMDTGGTLREANRAALAFAGISPESVIGQPFWQTPWWVGLPEQQQKLRDAIDRAAKGEFVRFEACHPAPDGSLVYVDFSIKPVLDETGALVMLIPEWRDITDFKKVEEELRVAKDAAESANRTKSQFLANMSHELRTPLNSVIGFANILRKNKQGALTEKELSYLGRILDNGKHLLELINDILDLAKIEAGRMEVHFSMVAVGPLVQSVVERLEGRVLDKPIRLLAEVPENVQPVYTDPGKLEQVLVNLVGNAIKFTEVGSVTVRLVADDQSRAQGIEVIDSGIGIPDDRIAAIFEPFSQAESSTSRRYGGTGLGLTISRSMCELMDCRLEVESKLGVGSTFRVRFGAAAHPSESPPPPMPIRVEMASKHPRPPRVLIVDDDVDARELLRHTVQELGWSGIEASSGPQALELARTHHPDLITLDLLMPVVSGFEVLQQLKSDPATASIPVIVVSIVAQDNRGLLLGAVELLTKPLDAGLFADVLRRHLVPDAETILFVGSDPAIVEAISQQFGAAVLTRSATDFLQANEILANLSVALLVVEWADGEELQRFLENLRRQPNGQNLPVVIVAAQPLSAGQIESLEHQAAVVLQTASPLAGELKSVLSSAHRPLVDG